MLLTASASRVASAPGPRRTVHPELAHGALPPLPLALVQAVLLCLSVDERLLAALVSRAFRAAVADPSLWRVVNLAPGCGVAEVVSAALLHAISAKAAGGMVELDAPRLTAPLRAAFLHLLADSALSLRRVRLVPDPLAATTFFFEPPAFVLEVLHAAPRLAHFEADVACSPAQSRAMLRNEPPYGPLRVRLLKVDGDWGEDGMVALVSDARGHPSLTELAVRGARLQSAAACAAPADAAVGRRLRSLTLHLCPVSPTLGRALARVLRDGGALTRLDVFAVDGALLDAACAPAFCAALAASREMSHLSLNGGLFEDRGVGGAVVAALVGHPSVVRLSLGVRVEGRRTAAERAAIASLACLLAADAPALASLNVAVGGLGDAGLRPVVAALRGCTFLRTLDVALNDATPAFARDELLPAVAANASLRTLDANGCGTPWPDIPELAQAEELVAARV